ncbi:hypothetical protein CLV63_11229 [Murinocardiopsis flavida]|uniref:Uncharacterized protein n=1 Tax=Murinocardiopsis flavida TaxID=645275 RepID=A0A2P8DG04_9ACTN|nr:hypothetical protein [Murinocardiopsis flavida]PSK96147.1 hypothetical protein CLV63_11229 [Murinocardiopsis flavida]
MTTTATAPVRLWEPGLAYTDHGGGWFAGERSTHHHDTIRLGEAEARRFADALFTAETTGADAESHLLLPMWELDGGLYLQNTHEPGQSAARLGPDAEGYYLVGAPEFVWDQVLARPADHPAGLHEETTGYQVIVSRTDAVGWEPWGATPDPDRERAWKELFRVLRKDQEAQLRAPVFAARMLHVRTRREFAPIDLGTDIRRPHLSGGVIDRARTHGVFDTESHYQLIGWDGQTLARHAPHPTHIYHYKAGNDLLAYRSDHPDAPGGTAIVRTSRTRTLLGPEIRA